ncbi:MAG: hypothetical protein EHM58_12620 [Ignavibacteriae bacterium]|nr:MAG: hypothetical protein EHM58_12620 [Ignavibacteriota bacterium]
MKKISIIYTIIFLLPSISQLIYSQDLWNSIQVFNVQNQQPYLGNPIDIQFLNADIGYIIWERQGYPTSYQNTIYVKRTENSGISWSTGFPDITDQYGTKASLYF